MNLWQAWNLSKTWATRPSEIYGISDDVAAYCFDQAVTLFGQSIEAAIAEATEDAKDTPDAKRKAERVLDKWIIPDADENVASADQPAEVKKFKDPFVSS